MTRIGVVGAGRVGAVLAAALRTAGHDIVAVAGESPASRTRIETLLPGVHVDKPTAVARACDLLLLTVPDDMLENVVNMLSASGAIRAGQYVVHTSGKHGLAALEPAAARGAHVLAMHPAMTFTGTDVDLARLPGCVFGVTAADDTEELARSLVADLGGSPIWVPEEKRALYHAGPRTARTTSSRSSPRPWTCCASPEPTTPPRRCARCSTRPSTTPSPTATQPSPDRSSAVT
jgi:predicted short-subunit dehydrogenase-like oxidoreductase (DUF2520 family)